MSSNARAMISQSVVNDMRIITEMYNALIQSESLVIPVIPIIPIARSSIE